MKLTRKERRLLSEFCCLWCDHQLDQPGCSAIWPNPECTGASRKARREKILRKLDQTLGGEA